MTQVIPHFTTRAPASDAHGSVGHTQSFGVMNPAEFSLRHDAGLLIPRRQPTFFSERGCGRLTPLEPPNASKVDSSRSPSEFSRTVVKLSGGQVRRRTDRPRISLRGKLAGNPAEDCADRYPGIALRHGTHDGGCLVPKTRNLFTFEGKEDARRS